jgi:LEA14-like dessication related protein
MGLIKTFLIILFVIIILACIFLGLYIDSLKKIELKDIEFDEIKEVNLNGFTLNGRLKVYNGGLIPITFNYIDYQIILEKNGETLGNGTIHKEKINPKQTKEIEFENRIIWTPSSDVAWGLITPGKTYAIFQGKIHVVDFFFLHLEIPFEERFDLEIYIRQFAKSKIQQTVEKVVDTGEKIVQGIKDLGSKVGEGLKNLFS